MVQAKRSMFARASLANCHGKGFFHLFFENIKIRNVSFINNISYIIRVITTLCSVLCVTQMIAEDLILSVALHFRKMQIAESSCNMESRNENDFMSEL